MRDTMLHSIIAPPQFSNTYNNSQLCQGRLGEYNFTEMRMRGIYNYEPRPRHWEKKLSGINGQCRQENCGKAEMSDPQLQPIMAVQFGHFLHHY